MKEVGKRAVEQALAVWFGQTFISRMDCYPLQCADGSYTAIKRPLTPRLIAAHITGEITIGAYALDRDSRAKWLCLDADEETEWHGLVALATELHHQDVPSYLELSRRGGHLWLFFEAIAGSSVRRFGKHLIKEHNLIGVEVYPKQDELRTGPGSLVRLPLGIHRKYGHRYHFITTSGEPLAPTIREQIRLLANPSRVPTNFISTMIARTPEPTPRFPQARTTPLPEAAYGGLPSERIKHSITVFDFVSQFVEVDRSGKGLCPFHDDHVESFSVNQEGNYWACFAGCGGGSVIDFWMKWRHLHGQDNRFKATVTDLARLLL